MGVFKKIIKGTFIVAAAVGTFFGAKGFHDSRKAKKINKEAKQIESEALALHDKALKNTNDKLYDFGEKKKQAIDRIVSFADLIEKIQERPDLSDFSHSNYDIDNADFEKMRIISNDLRIAMATSAGAAAGALIGFAALGVSFFAIAPAVAGGGFVLFAKGEKIKKEAIKNKQKAIELKKNVSKIVKFYDDVAFNAQSLNKTLSRIITIHNKYFIKVSNILAKKNNWRHLNKKETTNIQNCILLTDLLAKICNTRIVIQSNKESVPDQIDKKAISKTQNYVYEKLTPFLK